MGFAHLHVHTEYSLLDGSSKIKELVSRAKNLGMDSIAITDHGVMYGVIDFYRAAKEIGIKPIIGCEVYVSPSSRFDREILKGEDRYYHLVLLAENDLGYHNLMKIVSRGFTEGFYYKPRIDCEVLQEYHEGIIALSACLAGEVASYIRRNEYDKAKESAIKYNDIFGQNNFYLELQDHGYDEQKIVNNGMLRLSKELDIPMVATNDIHYTLKEDASAHDILLCIQTNKKVNDQDRMRYEGGQFYCKSPEEMQNLFPYARQAIENTQKIADRCNVEIVFGEQKVPKYQVPEGYDSYGYLEKLCKDGLKKRYNPITKELTDRLDYELTTIKNMGYVDYFLIVSDFINYAKNNDIAVGPGRGSAAGSIVSYCLEITNIDPIRFSLLFERFLNPERVSMPDIDIDFCYERRQEVIDYVVGKYGKEKVVQIVTFGTMAAKGVIRDVGRALDMPYAFVDSISKMIPNDVGITINRALTMNPDLAKAYDEDEQIKNLIDMSKRLEGLPRHTSMHAAGVVIGQRPIDEFVPLSRGADDAITTQFTMTTIEQLGLLKMDFLGLRTLTVIQNAVKFVKQSQNIEIDIDNLDTNDKKVYELISSGKTEGIFQLESAGMKNFMKELKPQCIEDIIAGISLYRPGPMDFIPQYLKGKNDQGAITYKVDSLEKILAPTYGCIVYQEQVMQIVMELAGYTLGRSDLVRRAMSKKKVDVMEKERINFVYGNEELGVKGCINNGIDENVANAIYDEMIDFAKYAFNKSHAAAYAVVAFQTAYLKCYYPVEFMAALITSVIDNTGKVAEYINACRQIGIKILPPDINEGFSGFSVSKNSIRYGLTALKSVGKSVIEGIVAERNQHGIYKSMEDFIERLSNKEVNKRTVESFIKAGAFDSLGVKRKQLMLMYVSIMDNVNQNKKNGMSGQMSLLDLLEDEDKKEFETVYPDVPEYDTEELLAYEKEVLGIYVSGHPLEKYVEIMKKNITANSNDFIIDEETNECKAKDQKDYVLGGMISKVIIKITKNNKSMAFISLEDLYGTVEVIIFPREYEKFRNLLKEDNKVFVSGKASISEEEGKLILSNIIEFNKMPKELWLQFNDNASYSKKENDIYELCDRFSGGMPVVIYLRHEKKLKRLPNRFWIDVCGETIDEFENIFGKENVKVVEKSIAYK